MPKAAVPCRCTVPLHGVGRMAFLPILDPTPGWCIKRMKSLAQHRLSVMTGHAWQPGLAERRAPSTWQRGWQSMKMTAGPSARKKAENVEGSRVEGQYGELRGNMKQRLSPETSAKLQSHQSLNRLWFIPPRKQVHTVSSSGHHRGNELKLHQEISE